MLHFGGQGWIRTIVLVWEQIYSLPPLATRPPTHDYLVVKKFCVCGAPSRIRTLDPPVMSRLLWPTELREHFPNARIIIRYFLTYVNTFSKKNFFSCNFFTILYFCGIILYKILKHIINKKGWKYEKN